VRAVLVPRDRPDTPSDSDAPASADRADTDTGGL
jgi:hypothetical protein